MGLNMDDPVSAVPFIEIDTPALIALIPRGVRGAILAADPEPDGSWGLAAAYMPDLEPGELVEFHSWALQRFRILLKQGPGRAGLNRRTVAGVEMYVAFDTAHVEVPDTIPGDWA